MHGAKTLTALQREFCLFYAASLRRDIQCADVFINLVDFSIYCIRIHSSFFEGVQYFGNSLIIFIFVLCVQRLPVYVFKM